MARRTIVSRGGGNISNVLTDYRRFVNIVEDEAARIFEEAAKIVLEETKPLVPVQTGALLESGRAFSEASPRGVRGVVAFGGPENPVSPTRNAPIGIVNYAAMVHEDLDTPHIQGQAKFLEQGGIAAAGRVDSYIISELKKIEP